MRAVQDLLSKLVHSRSRPRLCIHRRRRDLSSAGCRNPESVPHIPGAVPDLFRDVAGIAAVHHLLARRQREEGPKRFFEHPRKLRVEGQIRVHVRKRRCRATGSYGAPDRRPHPAGVGQGVLGEPAIDPCGRHAVDPLLRSGWRRACVAAAQHKSRAYHADRLQDAATFHGPSSPWRDNVSCEKSAARAYAARPPFFANSDCITCCEQMYTNLGIIAAPCLLNRGWRPEWKSPRRTATRGPLKPVEDKGRCSTGGNRSSARHEIRDHDEMSRAAGAARAGGITASDIDRRTPPSSCSRSVAGRGYRSPRRGCCPAGLRARTTCRLLSAAR